MGSGYISVCIVYCLVVVASQELEGFLANSTVDFVRDQVLADYVLEDDRLTTATDTSKGSESVTEATGKIWEEGSSQQARATPGIVVDNEPDSRSAAQMPPHIRWPDTQNRIVVMEQHKNHYRVTCMADGEPEIVYTWLKDSTELDDSGQYIKAFKNGTLTFEEFNSREDGLFQCLATNQYGTSVSVKVPIVLERPPSALAGDENLTKTYEAVEGLPMEFPCAQTPPTVPDYTKRWYLRKDTVQLQLSERIGTDAQGVLRFAYVEPADASSYICALVPEIVAAGDSIRLYNTAILNVQKGTTVSSGPKLSYASTNVKAVVGNRAILECFFSGFPIPKITWKQRNQEIAADNKRFSVSFGRRLTIQDVREEDAGVFSCTATNGYGTVSSTLNLNVTGPPQKIAYEGLYTTVKAEGEEAVLKCKARAIGGQHLETPIWFRNGQPFNESSQSFSDRYSFGPDRTELTIRNLDKNLDTACFQCNVSNSEGYLFYDGYLKIINAIRITKRPDKYITVSGASLRVDISVAATGDACCGLEYQWLLNGKELTADELRKPPFVWDNAEGNLMFDTSGVSNETLMSSLGTYACRVSNIYRHTSVSFVIYANASSPEAITAAEGGVGLWWIGLLCGILLILIAVFIIIVVIKSNYPRNTYPLEKAEIKHHLNPEQDLLDQSFQEI